MSILSLVKFKDEGIRFQNRNGKIWTSLTDMGKASGKLVGDWNRLKATSEFLQEFESIMGFPIVESNPGGSPETTGTWAIEEVAIEFAGWCNVKFKIWMIQQIKTLLEKGKVELVTPVETKVSLTPSINELLGYVKQSLLNCKIAEPLVEGVYLNGLAHHYPEIAAQVNEAHKLLAATTESEILLTPTSIGERLGVSNRKVNSLLLDMGYQVKNTSAKKGEPAYLATPKGIAYAANTIATGKVGDDSSYQHLKWKESILEVLESQLVAA
jgi:hypothetical protein